MEAEVRLLVAPTPAAPGPWSRTRAHCLGPGTAWRRLGVATSPVCCVWGTQALPAVCLSASESVSAAPGLTVCLSLPVLHPHWPFPSLSPWRPAGLPLSQSLSPAASGCPSAHISLPFSPSPPSGSQPLFLVVSLGGRNPDPSPGYPGSEPGAVLMSSEVEG